MAHITREYDDEGIVTRLSERSESFHIDPQRVRVHNITLVPETGNTPAALRMEIDVFVKDTDLNYVLGEPQG